MARPEPRSVRFVGRSPAARQPKPPFGLTGWSDDGEATVVKLDASEADLTAVEAVAAQVPESGAFAERTLVVLLGAATRGGGGWRRLILMGDTSVPRAPRCSALVMRGYVDVGAAVDAGTSHDLVWGWSSRRA
jgi:hypothetical protein